jgi:CTP:molybdopterin cytidylyltransferase MocA
MPEPRHAVVVLAGGASRRLGQPKALLDFDGERLIERVLRLASSTAPAQLVVVTGAPDSAEAIRVIARQHGAEVVVCEHWARGMGASLASALAALKSDIDAALVLLCDQPALDAAHLANLLARWRDAPKLAAASVYHGVRGVPALLPRSSFAHFLRDAGDRGARDWLRAQFDIIEVVDERLGRDVDTAADLPPR